MQDPFENMPSDTPMFSLSRSIEINIKQELKLENIPESIQPENGALM
jgi:putative membrane protein